MEHTINEIRQKLSTSTKNDLEQEYKDFFDMYPKLFEYIITTQDHEFDMNMVKLMLSTKRRLDNGELDKFSCDLIIGEHLGKEFVYSLPGIDEPSIDDKKRAVSEITFRASKTNSK